MEDLKLKELEIDYIQNVSFSTSFIFGETLKSNPDICKKLLETLLHIEVEKIEYVDTETTRKLNFEGKGIRLDVFVKGSDKVFDIEMQTIRKPALGKRARYYLSLIDGETLKAGDHYSLLKESYVLFICLEDPFPPRGLPVYTFERRALEDTKIALGDNSHIVFYNCDAALEEKDDELRKFLSYVKTKKADSAFTREIDKMVDAFKTRKVGYSEYMALKLQENDIRYEGRQEGLEVGRQEGLEKGRKESAKAIAANMKKNHLDAATIVKCTGLTENEVLAL